MPILSKNSLIHDESARTNKDFLLLFRIIINVNVA
ncbi:hypothetical protein B6N60_00834 [Richelia sinica FACHB-800]|uniref:Uncharacterized protein n=1 Tax=Richelia sinica FACHB-800 TaxID=1357546 RepID=A0A975Y3H9_9NOST|nr:hypothetical protein B6N60_00834 [Richelia sinica FACHB-800]